MNKLNIEMDIDPTAKFEMEEMAIRGGQAERYEPKPDMELDKEDLQEIIDRLRAQQQVDVHGMVKRYFQTITLPALWSVATDHYIAQQTKYRTRTRIGRAYKRKAYA